MDNDMVSVSREDLARQDAYVRELESAYDIAQAVLLAVIAIAVLAVLTVLAMAFNDGMAHAVNDGFWRIVRAWMDMARTFSL